MKIRAIVPMTVACFASLWTGADDIAAEIADSR